MKTGGLLDVGEFGSNHRESELEYLHAV